MYHLFKVAISLREMRPREKRLREMRLRLAERDGY